MSTLYIVATPIGNLSDITLRALDILKEVDGILCEDTRVSRTLFDRHEVKTPCMSYHHHSNDRERDNIIKQIIDGKSFALITDAGTPGISDPGNLLIKEIVERKLAISIVPIPGPSAVVTALSVAGFATDRFLFLGFIPHKKGKQTLLQQVASSQYTVAFFESTHRIIKTLTMLQPMISDERQLVVCRELTKKFESIYRGTCAEIIQQLDDSSVKGEFVVIVEGS